MAMPITPVATGEPRYVLGAASEPMLQFFAHSHLPTHLATVSAPFHDLAVWMVHTLPRNPERTAGLRKLLEVKECAVRALVYTEVT